MARLGGRPWLLGASPTIADVALATMSAPSPRRHATRARTRPCGPFCVGGSARPRRGHPRLPRLTARIGSRRIRCPS
jgi:glutathione S-transferase